MLQGGLSSSHMVSPASPPTTSSSNPRPGRLRGFSYLRHHTHGHHHHHHNHHNHNHNLYHHHHHHHHSHQSSSAEAPTVLTTSTVSTAPIPPPGTSSPRQLTPTSPLLNTAEISWIPTVSGVSGLSRVISQPAAAELSTSPVHAITTVTTSVHSRNRSRSLGELVSTDRSTGHQANVTMVRPPVKQSSRYGFSPDQPAPSIRFTPHNNTQSGRESLTFAPIERTLHTRDEHIRVGRFSERDSSNPNAPVGFKSKVVSRRHCEFWCDNGQWYVKDVKSSSGTFLNHIRLSAPGMESRAYPLNDGDLLQLGIDFKGGEEQIFRCVKVRVELNRAWQKALNKFNMSAHRQIRELANQKSNGSGSTNPSECSICLLHIAPCQPLFVAPCSHVWHYKCIRPLVEKEYPSFLCPNCRARADLERDIEDDEFTDDIWEVISDDVVKGNQENGDTQSLETAAVAIAGNVGIGEATTVVNLTNAGMAGPSRIRGVPHSATSGPISVPETVPEIAPERSNTTTPGFVTLPERMPDLYPDTPPRRSGSWLREDLEVDFASLNLQEQRLSHPSSESGSSNGGDHPEGPMTPMNDAGPFVLDGGDGHDRDGRRETLFLPLSLAQ